MLTCGGPDRLRRSSAARLTIWPTGIVAGASIGPARARLDQSQGYPLTTDVTIDAFLGYASRRYRIPEDFAGDWRVLVLPPAPPSKRGGVIFPIENSQWLVTLGGYARDYPPTDDEAAFMAFAKDLRSPLLHQAIQNAEPLSEIRGWQQTANLWRRFERLGRWPEGLSRSGTRCGPSTRSTGKV